MSVFSTSVAQIRPRTNPPPPRSSHVQRKRLSLTVFLLTFCLLLITCFLRLFSPITIRSRIQISSGRNNASRLYLNDEFGFTTVGPQRRPMHDDAFVLPFLYVGKRFLPDMFLRFTAPANSMAPSLVGFVLTQTTHKRTSIGNIKSPLLLTTNTKVKQK